MKSRFTQEDVIRIVQESRAEGVAVAAHKHSISEQTLYNWRKRFRIAEAPTRNGELMRLQQENARLKRLVAERDLDIDLLKENAGRIVANVSGRPETDMGAPWSEALHNTTFANYCDELGVENKS